MSLCGISKMSKQQDVKKAFDHVLVCGTPTPHKVDEILNCWKKKHLIASSLLI